LDPKNTCKQVSTYIENRKNQLFPTGLIRWRTCHFVTVRLTCWFLGVLETSPDVHSVTFGLDGWWMSYDVCLFVCFLFWVARAIFQLSELATVTITGDGVANLDLCLALTVFSSEGSFTCHTYCDTEPPFLRSYSKDPWFYLLIAVLLAKEQSLPILTS
jgi:hypothetical protein